MVPRSGGDGGEVQWLKVSFEVTATLHGSLMLAELKVAQYPGFLRLTNLEIHERNNQL